MQNHSKRLPAKPLGKRIGLDHLAAAARSPAPPGCRADNEWDRPNKKNPEKTNRSYAEMPLAPQMRQKNWTPGGLSVLETFRPEAAKGYITRTTEHGKQSTIRIGPRTSGNSPVENTALEYHALPETVKAHNKPQAHSPESTRTCNKSHRATPGRAAPRAVPGGAFQHPVGGPVGSREGAGCAAAVDRIQGPTEPKDALSLLRGAPASTRPGDQEKDHAEGSHVRSTAQSMGNPPRPSRARRKQNLRANRIARTLGKSAARSARNGKAPESRTGAANAVDHRTGDREGRSFRSPRASPRAAVRPPAVGPRLRQGRRPGPKAEHPGCRAALNPGSASPPTTGIQWRWPGTGPRLEGLGVFLRNAGRSAPAASSSTPRRDVRRAAPGRARVVPR